MALVLFPSRMGGGRSATSSPDPLPFPSSASAPICPLTRPTFPSGVLRSATKANGLTSAFQPLTSLAFRLTCPELVAREPLQPPGASPYGTGPEAGIFPLDHFPSMGNAKVPGARETAPVRPTLRGTNSVCEENRKDFLGSQKSFLSLSENPGIMDFRPAQSARAIVK